MNHVYRLFAWAFFLSLATLSGRMAIADEPPAQPECVVDGWVNLYLSGDENSGTISGTIDNGARTQFVNWSVSLGWIHGALDDAMLNLRLEQRFTNQFMI